MNDELDRLIDRALKRALARHGIALEPPPAAAAKEIIPSTPPRRGRVSPPAEGVFGSAAAQPAPAVPAGGPSAGPPSRPRVHPDAPTIFAALLEAEAAGDGDALRAQFRPALDAGLHRLGPVMSDPRGNPVDFLDWYAATHRRLPGPGEPPLRPKPRQIPVSRVKTP